MIDIDNEDMIATQVAHHDMVRKLVEFATQDGIMVNDWMEREDGEYIYDIEQLLNRIRAIDKTLKDLKSESI